jgi:hypothetical protein
MIGRRTHLYPALGLTALVAGSWALRVALASPYHFLVNSDLYLYFLPVYEATAAALRGGHLPRWNPYQLCGIPWLATLQGGFFYPPHVLYLVLPGPLALATSGLLHLLLTAGGMALFCRRAGLGQAAAALAAVLFVLRGRVPHQLFFPTSLETIAWLPIGGLAILTLAQRTDRRAIALLAAAMAASLLAGFPQTAVYVVYAWAALLVALLFRSPRARWLPATAVFAGALLLGAAVAGIQLLPSIELTLAGTRQAAQLTADAMFPLGGPVLGNPGLQITRREGLSGGQFSFGILGLALAPAALLTREHRSLALGMLALGVLAFGFALGPLTPLFDLYRLLPLLGAFRVPSRILVLTDFSFALLAAIALDTLARSDLPPVRARAARGLALAGAAFTAGLAAAGYGARGGALGPLLVGAATAASLLGSRLRLAAALLAVAVAELLLVPPRGSRLPYDPASDALFDHRAAVYRALAEVAGADRVWVFNPAQHVDLGPKLATRHRLRTLEDYEPMSSRRQAEYFTFLTDGATRLARPPWVFAGSIRAAPGRGHPPLSARRRLLDLAATRYLVLPDNALDDHTVTRLVADAGFERRAPPDDGLVLFENPAALPRAFTVHRTAAAPSPDELLAALSEQDFDPLVLSYVEGDPGFVAAAGAPSRGRPATIVRDEAEVVEVEASLAAPGLLVLADSFYPGWQATVDGAAAPILATNHLFRGVPVPAGRHRVQFVYRPWTLPAGAAVTLAGCLGILLLLTPALGREE